MAARSPCAACRDRPWPGWRWAFWPEAPWPPGGYLLRVSTALEDLAGNSLERLFDEATEPGREPRLPARGWVDLPFTVGGRP